MRLTVKPVHRMTAPPPLAFMRTVAAKLALIALALVLLACAGPFVGQPAAYHAFADHRAFLGIPFTMDVLSNLPFALGGLVGLWLAWPCAAGAARVFAASRAQGAQALVFFSGLVLTAGCSAWYHLNHGDAGLAVDRYGMVVAFAGLLGLAAGGRAGPRAGALLTVLVLALGPLTVAAWSLTGNVMPWLVVQLGGLLVILWLASLAPVEGALPVRWFLVVAVYALAKCLELGDHLVYDMTGHLVSGHSLKHVVASLAAWPVVNALLQRRVNTCGVLGSPDIKAGQNRTVTGR